MSRNSSTMDRSNIGTCVSHKRLTGDRRQPSSQLQRRFHAHGFGVADPAQPRQLRNVQSKEAAQPAVVRQQPLRDVRDRFAADAGIRNM